MGSQTRWLAEEAILVLLVSSVNRVEADQGRLWNLWPTQTQTSAHICVPTHMNIHAHTPNICSQKKKNHFIHSVDLLF